MPESHSSETNIPHSEIPTPDAHEAPKEKEQPIEAYFKIWKELEDAPPQPNEEILVSGLNPEDEEYQKLLSVGVTAEQLKIQRVPRHLLQAAGFVFNNYPLRLIEKPLLNATVDGVDYGKRKLLTQAELDAIVTYQRQHPELYGSAVVATDEFRKDIMQFLLTAEPTVPAYLDHKVNTFRMARGHIDSPYRTHEEYEEYKLDKLAQKVDPLYKKLVELHHQHIHQSEVRAADEDKYIETHLQDEMSWEEPAYGTRFPYKARGRNFSAFETRKSALNHLPSPFLDSGFHFPPSFGNPDFLVQKADKSGVFRVNALVLHLASRGLSEMGGGNDGKGEQDYTLGNYIAEIFPQDAATKEKNTLEENRKFNLKAINTGHEILRGIQRKMKLVARVWAESDQSPPEAKALLAKINTIEKEFKDGKVAPLKQFLGLLRKLRSR